MEVDATPRNGIQNERGLPRTLAQLRFATILFLPHVYDEALIERSISCSVRRETCSAPAKEVEVAANRMCAVIRAWKKCARALHTLAPKVHTSWGNTTRTRREIGEEGHVREHDGDNEGASISYRNEKDAQDSRSRSALDLREKYAACEAVACARAEWLVSGGGVDLGGITRPRPADRLASRFDGLASHSVNLVPAKNQKWLALPTRRRGL
ncbi:hypothetical protein B0H11DRAFT_1917772 [Mycena galericulata]|nr:hypothetical protein B0H11DRAFT_1917772 [Mycena galericulata]